MARVFLGLGSNQGDRRDNLSRALQRLGRVEGIRIVQMSPVYETEPVGGPSGQSDYLNSVIEVDAALPPRALLDAAKRIEGELGRAPSDVRWAPRPIDIDILLYADRVIQEPDLVIPHAELHRRRFVLEPLAQLDPSAVHPVLGKTVAELLAEQRDQAVEPFEEPRAS